MITGARVPSRADGGAPCCDGCEDPGDCGGSPPRDSRSEHAGPDLWREWVEQQAHTAPHDEEPWFDASETWRATSERNAPGSAPPDRGGGEVRFSGGGPNWESEWWGLEQQLVFPMAGPMFEPPDVDLPALGERWIRFDTFGEVGSPLAALGFGTGYCPHPDDVSAADVEGPLFFPSAQGDGDAHQVRIPIGENNPELPQLVVLLHGGGGDPGGVSNVAVASAQAGFRTISLAWAGLETAREYCKFTVGVPDDATLNTCIEDRRNELLWAEPTGIVPQLVGLLLALSVDRPREGWEQFLVDGLPDWSRILLAGYSEGANEASFAMRQLAPHGVVLISGGGDSGTLEDTSDQLADWMTALPVNAHVVGLRHEDEEHDFIRGWTLHGMLSDSSTDVQKIVDFYDGFYQNHRLVRTDEVGNPEDAHESTNDASLKPQHMYLMCKAASG